jgi:hypothetical protein
MARGRHGPARRSRRAPVSLHTGDNSSRRPPDAPESWWYAPVPTGVQAGDVGAELRRQLLAAEPADGARRSPDRTELAIGAGALLVLAGGVLRAVTW